MTEALTMRGAFRLKNLFSCINHADHLFTELYYQRHCQYSWVVLPFLFVLIVTFGFSLIIFKK